MSPALTHSQTAVSGEPATPAEALRDQPSIRRVAWAGIFLALVFCVYSALFHATPTGSADAPSYMDLARDLRQLKLSHLHLRTPGYPLFLLVTGSDRNPTVLLFLASLGIHLAGTALAAYGLYRVGIHLRLVVSFLFISSLPWFIEPAVVIGSESLTQASLIAALAFLVGWSVSDRFVLAFAAAVSLACAAFIRPTYQFLAPACALIMAGAYAGGMLPGRSLRRFASGLAVVTALPTAALLLWSYLNYSSFGYFGTSSMIPYTMANKVLTTLEYLPEEHRPLREILIRYRNQRLVDPDHDFTGLDYLWRARWEVRAYFGNDEVRAVKTLQAAFLGLIRQKPMSYLFECVRPAGTYWMPHETLAARTPGQRAFWAAVQIFVIAGFFIQGIVAGGMVVAGLSSLLFRGRLRISHTHHAAVLAYVLGMAITIYTAVFSCCFATGEARYRQATEVIMLGCTAIGLSLWARALKGHFLQSGESLNS